jgi:hypothetical protein
MCSKHHVVASYRRVVSIVPLAILSSRRVGEEQGGIERLAYGDRSAQDYICTIEWTHSVACEP